MSSGLLFLSEEDFFIAKGTKGNILCHKIPGISLVLFYSTQCIHCQKLIPMFKGLPGTVGGCQFAMINVQTNKNCVIKSNETIAPIKYVPFIVLYVQGKPFMRYDGPYDQNTIKRFIIEVADKIHKKQSFMGHTNVKHDDRSIPKYSIGKPLYGEREDICYLEFNKAYGK